MSFAVRSQRFRLWLSLASVLFLSASLQAQKEIHGRKYQPPPQVTHIVVTVQKNFNAKPIPNAAVIFHATKDGKSDGNLEIKTDPDGRAIMDFIEVGSHVTVQVIANGFATFADEFDATADDKTILVKMIRPREQISVYTNNEGKAAQETPGTQEPVAPGTPAQTGAPAPRTAPPPVDSPQTTPTAPLSTPSTATPSPVAPGTPK